MDRLPTQFATAYQALNGQAPGVYSVEGYDLTTIMLKAIDSGVKDRAGMVNYVKNYSGDGLARHYKWNDKGELAAALIWIYKVSSTVAMGRDRGLLDLRSRPSAS